MPAHTFPHVVVIPAAADGAAPRPEADCVETLIIDRQPLFLAALTSLLEGSTFPARVVTSQTSDRGLEIAAAGSVDLVVCELRAEPLPGIEVASTLSRSHPRVPVVLLGDEGDESMLASALAANVAGVFTKDTALDEFLAGLRAVVAGHRAIASNLIGRLLERLDSPGAVETKRLPGQLSPTELEILAMIGQAQTIPSIAATRGISHKTVRNHLAKIYRKLELHGRTEAVLWAARMGLTES